MPMSNKKFRLTRKSFDSTTDNLDGLLVFDNTTHKIYLSGECFGSNIKDVSFSQSTGVITLTKMNGTVETINLGSLEKPTNKVTNVSSQSTDDEYPSAKCVYETFERKGEVVWEVQSVSDGILASETDLSQSPAWQLTGLDMTPYQTVCLYIRSGGTGSNATASGVIRINLESVNSSPFGHFIGSTVLQNPNNRNRLLALSAAVSRGKTKVIFNRCTSLYNTAATNANSDGRVLYKIVGYIGSGTPEPSYHTLVVVAPGYINVMYDDIFTTGMSGDSKISVNDIVVSWVIGDRVNINGVTKSVDVDGSGNASVSQVLTADDYRAVYPASIATGSLASNLVSVTLPSTYSYQTSGGRQVLATPMAAYLVDDGTTDQILFHHITSALVIRIKNSVSTPLTIDQITITSDNYNISGDFTFNISNIDSMAPVSGGNSVSMVFNSEPLTIASNSTVDVQIPVAAVGASNHFTVNVASHFATENGNIKCLTFNKTQSTGGALDRGYLAYAFVTMSRSSADCVEDLPMSYENDAYVITNAAQFVTFVEAVNIGFATAHGSGARNNNFRLANDIDMSGITIAPIHDFHRTLQGNGHTISNLHIVQDGTADAGKLGLFSSRGSYANPLVTDLTLTNVTLEYTADDLGDSQPVYIGSIVGYCNPGSANEISNCTVNGMTVVSSTLQGSNTGSNKYVGGIAGYCSGSGGTFNIINSNITDVTLTLANYAGNIRFGGILGANNSPVEISGCNYTATTTMNILGVQPIWYGGFVGQASGKDITITNSTTTHNANIVGGSSANFIAGAVGKLQTSAATLTFNGTCVSRGTISCKTNSTREIVAYNNNGWTIMGSLNTTDFEWGNLY